LGIGDKKWGPKIKISALSRLSSVSGTSLQIAIIAGELWSTKFNGEQQVRNLDPNNGRPSRWALPGILVYYIK